MRRLIHVIVHTGRFEDMREFYEKGLALPVRAAADDRLEFDTAGAALALRRMDDPLRQGIVLRFETDDLEAARREMSARGVEASPVVGSEDGRSTELPDPDGNTLALLQPAMPAPSGAGERITTIIVNVADMATATEFYRDRFGLPAIVQSPWWTEFDTGATKLSLHPKTPGSDGLQHNEQPVVVGFGPENLDELAEELDARGLEFSAGPVEQRHGRFAEVEDPDGNVVLFRESGPRHAPTLHDVVETLEEEEDTLPHRAGMKPPAHKTAHAASRVAVKPEYKAKKGAKAGKNGKAAARPRRRAQAEKARPAVGRLRKAERRTLERKKQDVAKRSRSARLKRAAPKTAKRRVTARRGRRARSR